MQSLSVSDSTFDIRNLSYLNHIDDNLCCPICHSPLIDPVSTSCRHTFCNECIASALDRSSSCPVDRSPLRAEQISMAPIMIANLVNDLIVLCPNSELGCAASCPRYLVGRHLKEDCGFVAVTCPGCDDAVLRKDSGSECLHQEIECEFCSVPVRKLDLESHKARCPQLSSSCSHCAVEFSRSLISSHESSCDEAILPCDACSVGCPWAGPRRATSEHAESCVFVRLRPVFQAQADRTASLELENKALRKKIDILLPPHGSREDTDHSGACTSFDDQTLRLLKEQECHRSHIERLSAAQGETDLKMGMLMMHMNDDMRTKEEIAMMGAAINNIRNQMHWIQRIAMRGQSMDYQRSAATASGTAPSTASSGAANKSSTVENSTRGGLPARRLSDSNSGGDRVKL